MKGAVVFGFAIVLCLLAGDGVAQEPLKKEKTLGVDWLIERLDWKGEIEPGTTVVLENPYGEIRARGTEDQIVEIVANVQKGKKDDHLIYFKTREEKGKLIVSTIYEGDASLTAKEGGDRRMDMTIFVPKGSLFIGKTFKDQIDARGLGDVDVSSERGKIFVRNEGHAKIVTRQGNIRAVLKQVDWSEPVHIESTVGNLEVELPKDASFSATAETAGRITTDYTTTIETDDATWVKTAVVKVGDEKNEIRLINKNGNIGLLRGRWGSED